MKDSKYTECRKQCGKDGLLMWLELMGLLAENYNGNPEKPITIFKSELKSITGLYEIKFNLILNQLAIIFDFNYNLIENKLSFTYPKFLKKQRKFSQSVSGKFKVTDNRLKSIDIREESKEDFKKDPPIIDSSHIVKTGKLSSNYQDYYDIWKKFIDVMRKEYQVSIPGVQGDTRGRKTQLKKHIADGLTPEKYSDALNVAYHNPKKYLSKMNGKAWFTFDWMFKDRDYNRNPVCNWLTMLEDEVNDRREDTEQ